MSENNLNQPQPEGEKLEVGLQIVSFCIPLVGAILYFVYKKDHPRKSKMACYAALIGFGIGIVLNIIFAVLGIGVGAMSGGY